MTKIERLILQNQSAMISALVMLLLNGTDKDADAAAILLNMNKELKEFLNSSRSTT